MCLASIYTQNLLNSFCSSTPSMEAVLPIGTLSCAQVGSGGKKKKTIQKDRKGKSFFLLLLLLFSGLRSGFVPGIFMANQVFAIILVVFMLLLLLLIKCAFAHFPNPLFRRLTASLTWPSAQQAPRGRSRCFHVTRRCRASRSLRRLTCGTTPN